MKKFLAMLTLIAIFATTTISTIGCGDDKDAKKKADEKKAADDKKAAEDKKAKP